MTNHIFETFVQQIVKRSTINKAHIIYISSVSSVSIRTTGTTKCETACVWFTSHPCLRRQSSMNTIWIGWNHSTFNGLGSVPGRLLNSKTNSHRTKGYFEFTVPGSRKLLVRTSNPNEHNQDNCCKNIHKLYVYMICIYLYTKTSNAVRKWLWNYVQICRNQYVFWGHKNMCKFSPTRSHVPILLSNFRIDVWLARPLQLSG